MRNRIIKYSFLLIALGACYYFANNYTNGVKEQTAEQTAINESIKGSIDEIKSEIVYVNNVIDSNASLHKIIPVSFNWTETILQLESMESQYEMESQKYYVKTAPADYNEYKDIDGRISIYKVTIDTVISQSTLNAILKDFYEIDQLVIINYIEYLPTIEDFAVTIELLYFVGN